MLGRKRLACSFCGKSAAEVEKLVAGPKVYICNECVTTASRIMKGDDPGQTATNHNGRGFLAKLRDRLRRLFEDGRFHRSAYQSVALEQR